MTAMVSFSHVTKSYDAHKAVDELSLTIAEGEFFGFLGPNGAGKTTTIRMLTGIIPPDSGTIAVRDESIATTPVTQILGVVPESRGFYDWMTAPEYLGFFGELYGLSRSERGDRIDSLLRQVGLHDRRRSRIGTYSRGMKQRLGLARALINAPRLLVLDEPTLGLDPQGQGELQTLLRQLNRNGVTIFLSSHLLHEVADLCTRIAIINRGRLVAHGTIDDLRRQTALREAYAIQVTGDLPPITGFQIRSRAIDGATTRLVVEGSLTEANRLLDVLRQHGAGILDFHAERESLADIFLAVTR
jgi:ABC-2 type transport system ATP-binding protein